MSKIKVFDPQKTSSKKHKLIFLSFLSAGLLIAVLIMTVGLVEAWQGGSQAPDEDSFVYFPLVIGAPIPPLQDSYEDTFTEGIEPWAARRWSAGPDFEIDANNDCNDGRCHFMEVEVNHGQSYVIISPLVGVDAPFPYKVSTRAKLLDREDGNAYGIIFGGNWDGNTCPGQDFTTCFTEYYEFRVRYRDGSGDSYLEWKLKKVEGHDQNNQNFGPDIITWKRLDGVDPGSWVNWEVEVHNNGQLYIFANNVKQAGSAKDSTYINNHYFGVIGRTGDHSGSHILFDRVRVE